MAANDTMTASKIEELLGPNAEKLLDHTCKTISKDQLILPGPDHIEKNWAGSNRSNQTLRSLSAMLNHGRLGGTGYLSILPVDQGLSTVQVHHLRQIQFILILKILSNWP
jgi:fructose-bisphosphate aldolase, class I